MTGTGFGDRNTDLAITVGNAACANPTVRDGGTRATCTLPEGTGLALPVVAELTSCANPAGARAGLVSYTAPTVAEVSSPDCVDDDATGGIADCPPR